MKKTANQPVPRYSLRRLGLEQEIDDEKD